MFLDHAIQIGEISGISEYIDISHRGRLVMLQNVANKVAPDESAATGYQNAHSAY
jgi:2-oxoglutarate dehydrogenase complex dehydrogenase (E1) component-like enzyme